jgi:hypothetical protein
LPSSRSTAATPAVNRCDERYDLQTTSIAFMMCSVNDDDRSLMKRCHKHGDEKRSVVIMGLPDCQDWLSRRKAFLRAPRQRTSR